MSDIAEIISSVFSLVVMGFVVIVLWMVLQGGDITGIASGFADFMPFFVLGLVLVFFVAKIFQNL
jgi:hypothetical protein